MKRERRDKETSHRSDPRAAAFPQPLSRGSVDRKLIREAGPRAVKVVGTCDQIAALREKIRMLEICSRTTWGWGGGGGCASHQVRKHNRGCDTSAAHNTAKVVVGKSAAEAQLNVWGSDEGSDRCCY